MTSTSAHNDQSPQGDPLLVAAVAYAKQGIPVFPLHTVDARGRCSCSKTVCSNPGKHPRTRNGLHDAATSEFVIRRWWARWPQSNIGIRTGDKFDVLDPDGGDAAFAEAAEYGVDLSALHSITGGGKHYPFKLPEGITLRNKVKDTGVTTAGARMNGRRRLTLPASPKFPRHYWKCGKTRPKTRAMRTPLRRTRPTSSTILKYKKAMHGAK